MLDVMTFRLLMYGMKNDIIACHAFNNLWYTIHMRSVLDMKGIGAIEYDDNVIFIRWYNKYDIIEIYICKGGTHLLHHHNYAHSSRFFYCPYLPTFESCRPGGHCRDYYQCVHFVHTLHYHLFINGGIIELSQCHRSNIEENTKALHRWLLLVESTLPPPPPPPYQRASNAKKAFT